MAIKKSELYGDLWRCCDELRGGMDASQYKDYVLVLLFVKYVSDKAKNDKNFLIEVPKGGSFADMILLKNKSEIGDGINKIISKLAEANDLKGIIDVADFNDSDKLGKGKDMVDKLSNLVGIFENPALDFSKNKAEGDDILGDAYEYLMRHFATESGKSKGQFYTPSEVSKVMAKVISINQTKRQDQTIYDPTCGSGSLLLKAVDESEHGITIYGQENDVATRALAKMNMILHGQEMAEIFRGNTISEPEFKEKDGTLKKFDYVVANPPFSTKSWSNGIKPEEDKYERFDTKEWGAIPPKKNGDYAFLLHMIKSLKSTGKAAIILPHGVLYRADAESDIRTNIVKRGYIKGIIGLPTNLFFGTGIPACIIVLDKENAQSRKGIFMVDASKGFYKDGNKNRLRARDVHKIVDVFTKQIEVPKFSRMVPVSEISDIKNDYNLNIPRYIDNQEPEDLQDIDAHLMGNIPNRDVDELENYWKVYPTLKKVLFGPSKREDYSILKITSAEIKKSIFEHPEFIIYSKNIEGAFINWKKRSLSILKEIKIGSNPKKLIFNLGEDLLNNFSKLELIDKYDIYQHLMLYWDEIMQDDAYLIAVNGWTAKPERVIVETESKKTGIKKTIDKGWKCDLIPKELVINKYFITEKREIEKLHTELENVQNEMEILDEENTGEEDLFIDVRNEAENINKKDLIKRINEIRGDSEFIEELKLLETYLKLTNNEKELKDMTSALENELDKKVLAQYSKLKEDEIKTLVVEDKWLFFLHNSVKFEMEKVSRKLAGRINELAERYETSLPELQDRFNEITNEVDNHLKDIQKLSHQNSAKKEANDPWDIKPLSQLIDIPITDGPHLTPKFIEDGVPFLSVNNIVNNHVDFSDLRHISKSDDEIFAKKCKPKKGDILLGKAASVGKVALIDFDRDFNIWSPLALIRLNKNNEPQYFYYGLQTRFILNQIKLLTNSSSQGNIGMGDIEKLEFPVPSKNEQKTISKIISDMDEKIENLDKLKKKCVNLKEGMMQELLTGRIRLI